jgi:hypothetical protein
MVDVHFVGRGAGKCVFLLWSFQLVRADGGCVFRGSLVVNSWVVGRES